MKLSPNEILILNILQDHKKPMERREIITATGISDKNISAKIKALERKGFILTQKERSGRFVKQIIQLTKLGKREKLVKIVIEKKIPKREDVITTYEKAKKKRVKAKEKVELSEEEKATVEYMQRMKDLETKYLEALHEEELKAKKPKPPKITPKPLPESLELKKELRLLINLVLTHRKEEYSKYGYKSVSEIRAAINTLIDQLGS